jgi:hypothetical protein
VAVQADAWWQYGKLYFQFSKSRKKQRMLELLDRMGAEYSRCSSKSHWRVKITDGRLLDAAGYWLGPSKQFGPWVLGLPLAQLQVFCEELFQWDGCFTRNATYFSKSYNNVSIAQAAFTLIGKRTKLSTKEIPSGSFHTLNVSNWRSSHTSTCKRDTVQYDDTVYCVSVPSSFIVVRRGGKVVVTGNCQNIPRGDEGDGDVSKGAIKRMFVPPELDWVVGEMDYSQAELRMAALISQDDVMLDCYEQGIDLHKVMATQAFNTSIENVTKEQRTLAKIANFGIIYGISPHALAIQANTSVEVAQILINGFNKKFKGFCNWSNRQSQYVKKYSQSSSLFGHVRHLPEVRSPDDGVRNGAVRQGVNFPIQCTASNVAIYAGYAIQRRLTREGLRAYTYNQVHDSVWFACHKDDLHNTVSLMKGVAENMPFDFLKGGHPDYPRGVKMLVDFKVGPNMRDLEEYHAAVRQ